VNRRDKPPLATLVGGRNSNILMQAAGGSIARLLFKMPTASYDAAPGLDKLAAARALVFAALEECLTEGPVLSSPGAVRDLLKLRLARIEHEVFLVLFVDAQNRLIETEEIFRGTLTQTAELISDGPIVY
jgi:DNA repair protein RadC